MSNFAKYRHRGSVRQGAAALVLSSACWSGGLLVATFSEAIETFGAPDPVDVSLRHSNEIFSGSAIVSVAGAVLTLSLEDAGFSSGSNFVTFAAGAATWVRAVSSRVPLTAPVTQASLPNC
jgi:hypothetical protein